MKPSNSRESWVKDLKFNFIRPYQPYLYFFRMYIIGTKTLYSVGLIRIADCFIQKMRIVHLSSYQNKDKSRWRISESWALEKTRFRLCPFCGELCFRSWEGYNLSKITKFIVHFLPMSFLLTGFLKQKWAWYTKKQIWSKLQTMCFVFKKYIKEKLLHNPNVTILNKGFFLTDNNDLKGVIWPGADTCVTWNNASLNIWYLLPSSSKRWTPQNLTKLYWCVPKKGETDQTCQDYEEFSTFKCAGNVILIVWDVPSIAKFKLYYMYHIHMYWMFQQNEGT